VRGKEPHEWLRQKSTQEFIQQIQTEVRYGNSRNLKPEQIQRELRVANSQLIKKVQGKGKVQGTFAHWKIGLAYTEFLSPEIHSWFVDIWWPSERSEIGYYYDRGRQG
jgi:hypothetical protein